MPPVKKNPIVVAQTKLGESIDALTEGVKELLATVIEDYDAMCALTDGVVTATPAPVAKPGPRTVPSREAAPAAVPARRPGRPAKPQVEDEFDDDIPDPEMEEVDEPAPRKRGRPASTTTAKTKPSAAPAGRTRKSAPVEDEFEDDPPEEEEETEAAEEAGWDDWGEEEEEEVEEKPATRRPARR